MPDPRSPRNPATAHQDPRSAMARTSDTRPPKPYDPARGRQEPPAVTAARKRHQAINARIKAAQEALAAQEAGDEPGRPPC